VRILYLVHQFYPRFSSGTERFVLNVASSLQRDGHFAEVVTYDLYNTAPFRSELGVTEYAYQNIPVVAVRHKTMPVDVHSSCEDPEIHRFALEFLRQRKAYDILHCAHAMRLTPFLKAARESGLPYMATLTDFWFICPKIILKTTSGSLCAGPEGGEACRRLCPELPSKFVSDRLETAKEILFGAKAVVSPSRFLAAIFKKEFPELEISIIRHGMDARALKPNRRIYGQGDRIVFGYTGGLAPHKGVHLLVEAFRGLEAGNARLKVYGSYSHEVEYAQRLLKIAEGDKRIEFCGTYKPTDVGDVLQGIDVVVVPSTWYENYPLAVHEALACNVPVIAADIGGLAEAIRNSVNGFIFRVGDVAELKNKLLQVVENPQRLNKIKENLGAHTPMLVEEEAYLYERLYSMGSGKGRAATEGALR
jgi:glycosyltransferase involved in cell wall biosynthesis